MLIAKKRISMKKILFSIACLGWISSVTVHIMSITEGDITEKYPLVMGLHAGVFVVWIPMFLYLNKDKDFKQLQQAGFLQRSNPFATFEVMFKNAPTYLKIIAIAGFIYVPINFMMPALEPDVKVNTGRLFSGHWIAFYGVALASLYPFKKEAVL